MSIKNQQITISLSPFNSNPLTDNNSDNNNNLSPISFTITVISMFFAYLTIVFSGKRIVRGRSICSDVGSVSVSGRSMCSDVGSVSVGVRSS